MEAKQTPRQLSLKAKLLCWSLPSIVQTLCCLDFTGLPRTNFMWYFWAFLVALFIACLCVWVPDSNSYDREVAGSIMAGIALAPVMLVVLIAGVLLLDPDFGPFAHR